MRHKDQLDGLTAAKTGRRRGDAQDTSAGPATATAATLERFQRGVSELKVDQVANLCDANGQSRPTLFMKHLLQWCVDRAVLDVSRMFRYQ